MTCHSFSHTQTPEEKEDLQKRVKDLKKVTIPSVFHCTCTYTLLFFPFLFPLIPPFLSLPSSLFIPSFCPPLIPPSLCFHSFTTSQKLQFVRSCIHKLTQQMRQFPLGQDRYARQYWHLPQVWNGARDRQNMHEYEFSLSPPSSKKILVCSSCVLFCY